MPERIIHLTRKRTWSTTPAFPATPTRSTGTTEIAKQVGLDTAIAHGMLTRRLGGYYVHRKIGSSDRAR